MPYFSISYQADCQLYTEGEIQQYVALMHSSGSLVKTYFHLKYSSLPFLTSRILT